MTRASPLSARMLSFLVHRAASACFSLCLARIPRELAARDLSDIDIVRDGHGLEEPIAFAVLGDIDNAVADRGARRPVTHRSIAQPDVAAMKGVALDDAGDDSRRLRPPRADQAEDARDLPGENRKRCVAHLVLHRQIFHAEDFGAGRSPRGARARPAIELVGERSSDHVADDRFARERPGVVGYDVRAVTQNRDAVGDFERFLQRVTDEDDRNPILPQPVDQREK